jgi:hypothetical protein
MLCNKLSIQRLPELINTDTIETPGALSLTNDNQSEVRLFVTDSGAILPPSATLQEEKSTNVLLSGAKMYTGRPDWRQILREISAERRVGRSGREYYSVCACGVQDMLLEVQNMCQQQSDRLNRFHFHKETFSL